MRRRLVATLLSSICLIIATSILIAFIEHYAVPHTLTNMFIPMTCRVVGADCVKECGDVIQEDRGLSSNTGESMVLQVREQAEQQVAKGDNDVNRKQVNFKDSGPNSDASVKLGYWKNSVQNDNDRTQGYQSDAQIANQTLLDNRKKDNSANNPGSRFNVSYGHGVVHHAGSLRNNKHSAILSDSDTDQNQIKPHLKIKYTGMNSTAGKTAYKRHAQGSDFNLPETNAAAREISRCCQTGSSRCDRILVDVVETDKTEAVPLIEDPWVFYSMLTGDTSAVCPCPSCQVTVEHNHIPSVDIMGSTYMYMGDAFPCYANQYESKVEVLLYKMSTVMVLNLMFWPTLFFMVGFVGLFFSCLYLQYDECNQNWCAKVFRI